MAAFVSFMRGFVENVAKNYVGSWIIRNFALDNTSKELSLLLRLYLNIFRLYLNILF